MLQYTQTILHKVSFDQGLFQKELRKAMQVLSVREQQALLKWCEKQYGEAALRKPSAPTAA